MTDPVASSGTDVEGADASPRVVLTVRLHGRTHALLIEEFEPLRRRRRAARAAQLMLLGLVYERAHLRSGAMTTAVSPTTLPRAASGADFGLASEADAFVSAILRVAPGSSEEGDPPRGIAERPAGTDSPAGFRVRTRRRAEANESVPSAGTRRDQVEI